MKPVIWLLSGALSFWLPIIFAFAIDRSDTRMLVPNVLAVLTASLCYAALRWLYHGERLAGWMLFGLYVLGPILLCTATSFANGGFSQVRGWQIAWILLACIFPPIELLLAGVSGVGPGLLVVTAILASATTVEFTSATK